MIYKLVFASSFLMVFCALCNGENCYKSGDHSYEKYCDNFTGILPQGCIPAFIPLKKEANLKLSTIFKIHGCDFDKAISLIELDVVTLDLSYSNYTELKPFTKEYNRLIKFYAMHNQIREIPQNYFHKMPTVEEIDLSYNKIDAIKDFTFDGALSLVVIKLANNKIKSIAGGAFEKLENLQTIDLTVNSITSVNNLFKNNMKLNTLSLLKNPIKEFSCEFVKVAKNEGKAYFQWESIRMNNFEELPCGHGPLRVASNESGGFVSTPEGTITMLCNRNSFKQTRSAKIVNNIFLNPIELLKCLPPSLASLDLSDSFVFGQLNFDALSRFVSLQILNLRNSKLWSFDFSWLKNLAELRKLDISQNNLIVINNLANLKGLKKLVDLDMGQNQFPNGKEIIQSMSVDVFQLKLTGSNIGKLEANTFKPFIRLNSLYLSDTHLAFDDISVFDPLVNLKALDISSNDLQSARFEKSKVFQNLEFFYARDCKIKDVSQLVKLFGPSLKWLDLSGNHWGKIDPLTFSRYPNLISLSLMSMDLSHFDCNLLKNQRRLKVLDLSSNHLTKIDLTPLKSAKLDWLNLENNELTEIAGLTQDHFERTKLSTSNNQLSCEFLEEVIKQLQKWNRLQGAFDMWDQKHGQRCSFENQLRREIGQRIPRPMDPTRTTIKSTNESENEESSENWTVKITIIALLILVFIMGVYIFTTYRRRKKIERAGLSKFKDGYVNSLNPDLDLDAQADLLPYNNKYEFPREKLKLGKELGAGAFGVVLEATAQGILAHEEETKVAVKVLRNTASNEVMRALVSELKIMIHLGQHLNVINLLGAVTKDIANFNLMVIVEYCPFGNLQSFLTQNRRHFVNQIVPGTNEIDVKRISSNIPLSCPISDGMVMVGESTDAQPHLITTEDLLIWSFQIARGMDYLASRKVLHGDLAARNVLLCDDNVVKICDFGLARSLYKNEDYHYHMQNQRALPFKWLALESMNNCVFSTHTDVWSFGIVLWELFALGESPYPHIELDDIKRMLNYGYRMEKPEFATTGLYDIMLSCWCFNPEKRPTFNDLENNISQILGKTKSDHYIELNEPYLEANERRFNSGETDYVALLSSPYYQAPRAPANELQDTYLLPLAQCSKVRFSATNNLYVGEPSVPKRKSLNTIALRTFKANNLN